MTSKKKTLEQEINEFLEIWDREHMADFLDDISPLFDLYNVDEHDDWVAEAVGDDDAATVRLIRTVYLMSRIAEGHAGALCNLKSRFKNIYQRMEKEGTIEGVGRVR